MCGIAALVDYEATGIALHIGPMTSLVRHRGPDDEGYALLIGEELEPVPLGGSATPEAVWRSRLPYSPRALLERRSAKVALGHCRLSIVDLSPAGHQPMCASGGRYWIVYNGEIYNHEALRSELRQEGYEFFSNCDTEVILAAWDRWGSKCLERFNGMFAFVLIDRMDKRLYAVRDRFGVKPLYWWQSPRGDVAFASEIKQFSALPGWKARIDGQMAYDYLAWGIFDHTPATMFSGVRQVRGGELIELPLSVAPPSLETQRWYTLQARPFLRSSDDAAEAFRETFTDAIRLRLQADVPVGSCLSGGLDSSSIVCVVDRLQREQGSSETHRTFSAASHVARYDERRFAQSVIDATGADGHFIYPDAQGAIAELERLTWHQDEPFGSSSIFAQWCVFRLAAENGIKVMLDGQGADEQLAGYPGFLGPLLGSLLRAMRLRELVREFVAFGQHPSFGYAYSAQQLANAVLPDWLRQRLRSWSGQPSIRPAWLDVERLGAVDREPFGELRQESGSIAGLSRRLLLDTGLPMLLHTEDRNSMAHSVESRVPFLDYRLVELVLGMPDSYKLSAGVTKRVLRHALRAILPEEVRVRRDKLGFATPEEIWMKTSAKAQVRAQLTDLIDHSGGIVRPRALDEFDAVVAGRSPFTFTTWRLINFGAWLRCHSAALP